MARGDAFGGLLLFGIRCWWRREFGDGLGDVEDELVVAADVFTDESIADVHGGVLAGSFEV